MIWIKDIFIKVAINTEKIKIETEKINEQNKILRIMIITPPLTNNDAENYVLNECNKIVDFLSFVTRQRIAYEIERLTEINGQRIRGFEENLF